MIHATPYMHPYYWKGQARHYLGTYRERLRRRALGLETTPDEPPENVRLGELGVRAGELPWQDAPDPSWRGGHNESSAALVSGDADFIEAFQTALALTGRYEQINYGQDIRMPTYGMSVVHSYWTNSEDNPDGSRFSAVLSSSGRLWVRGDIVDPATAEAPPPLESPTPVVVAGLSYYEWAVRACKVHVFDGGASGPYAEEGAVVLLDRSFRLRAYGLASFAYTRNWVEYDYGEDELRVEIQKSVSANVANPIFNLPEGPVADFVVRGFVGNLTMGLALRPDGSAEPWGGSSATYVPPNFNFPALRVSERQFVVVSGTVHGASGLVQVTNSRSLSRGYRRVDLEEFESSGQLKAGYYMTSWPWGGFALVSTNAGAKWESLSVGIETEPCLVFPSANGSPRRMYNSVSLATDPDAGKVIINFTGAVKYTFPLQHITADVYYDPTKQGALRPYDEAEIGVVSFYNSLTGTRTLIHDTVPGHWATPTQFSATHGLEAGDDPIIAVALTGIQAWPFMAIRQSGESLELSNTLESSESASEWRVRSRNFSGYPGEEIFVSAAHIENALP